MSTETLSQQLAAGQTAQFGAGTNFLVLTSSAPLSIQAIQLGNSNKNREFSGVLQGFSFKADSADDGFDLLEVTSATAQSITLVVGNDDVAYPSTVTVAGEVQSLQVPAASVTDQAAQVTAAGQAALFPQNVARRRITVFSDPANNKNAAVYFRAAGKANNLGFIVPGQSVEFDGTYAVDYDAAAAGDTLYLLEES